MREVEIFYTPHADDEVLGMAGAILEAVDRGAHVVLVLVTDNRPSVRATDLFTDRLRCHWHGKQKHALAHIDLVGARMLEFVDAARSLGAHEVASLGIPEALGVEDYPRFVETIATSIRRYAIQYPGAVHHVVSGRSDYHAESGNGNLSHRGLADAAPIALSNLTPIRFHRVYIYSLPAVQRFAPVIRHLSPEIMQRKIQAMDAYRIYSPSDGRVAYGFHSVPDLFQGAAGDAREFEDLAA